jgi:hypothetical protein
MIKKRDQQEKNETDVLKKVNNLTFSKKKVNSLTRGYKIELSFETFKEAEKYYQEILKRMIKK